MNVEKYEVIHPLITLNLKKGTRTSDYRSNEPFPKFIRSSFLYIPYMPPGHNLQPLPRRSWGVFIIKNIISRPFNYVEQNGYFKILIRCVQGNGGQGGVVALQSFSTIKNSTGPFHFQSNNLFLKFLRQKWPSQNQYQMHFGEKPKCGEVYLPSNHSES